jgi:hypothetical protein
VFTGVLRLLIFYRLLATTDQWMDNKSLVFVTLTVKHDIVFFLYTLAKHPLMDTAQPHLVEVSFPQLKQISQSYFLITYFVHHHQVSFGNFLPLFKFFFFLLFLFAEVDETEKIQDAWLLIFKLGLIRQPKIYSWRCFSSSLVFFFRDRKKHLCEKYLKWL